MNRKNTIYAFCLISTVFILGGVSLIYNLSPLFDKIDEQIANGETTIMNGKIDASKLEALLLNGDYISDVQDARFISQWYKRKIETGKSLENLGAINSNRFKIPADSILSYGGEGLKARLSTEILQLGQDEEWHRIDKSNLSSTFGAASDSTAQIQIYVSEIEEKKILGIIPYDRTIDVDGVIVRLTRHWTNKNMPSENLPVSHESKTIGYAVTNKKGIATFHAPKGHSYSVIPIAEGFQYGPEKGTVDGTLTKDLKLLKFTQREHKLCPFRGSTYQQLKNDKALISRSPDDFKNAVTSGIAVFLIGWLLVLVIIHIIDRRQNRTTDSLLLLALMILSGMGLLTLYGQMLPLTDIFNAYKMAGFIVLGCVLMILLSCINYLKLFQWYRSKWTKSMGFGKSTVVSVAAGYPFLVLAIIMMVMLRFLGKAPEGSDARVNLGFFQPSEIVKYLILLFMVFFFIAKGDVIKTFGEKLTRLALRRQWAIIGIAVLAIALICLLFLGMLKDMGPGIVVLTTFILLYSVVRRDFSQLLLGIISYIIIVGCTCMGTDTFAVRFMAIVIWFIAWIGFSWWKFKTIYESAIFFNILISLFLVGGHLVRPFWPHMADRLFNRTNMTWSGIFDNAVPQGDQIAQGLWGTASGGLTGMGIGGGSPHFIPAGHTDLILNSLGEQMGWLGIIIVAVCFFILISRTAMAAQYSGHKFTFYLCLGLGLLTGVQFLFIALGCVGVIPLSGVPVPFLSYSGTSIVMVLAAYGIVLSISRHRGSPEALKSFVVNERRERDDFENMEAKSLNRNLFAGMVLFFVGVVCVTAINGYYQLIVSGKTQIRPAITSTNKGLRVLDYNPRITQIINMLDRGNIYDRNDLLLATSDKSGIASFDEIQDNLDIGLATLDELKGKRLKRYYPFGNNMVFMVGDLNRSDIYTNYSKVPIGYFAELQHADMLRGYDTNPNTIELTGSNYKFNRFLEPVSGINLKYKLHDYSALLPALSASIYQNPWIEKFNKSRNKRDIHLTIDAALQTKLQHNMAEYVKKMPNLSRLANLRASVVVLDAGSGELLTSANYPLPVTDSIINLRQLNLDTKGGAPSEWRKGSPITERDLGLTYQTAPGSTAKVLTALAGLIKKKEEMKHIGFRIKPFMNIEKPNAEPNINTKIQNRNGGEVTYLENAIKHSSNCYFIMLLNELNLYRELGQLYWDCGLTFGKSNIPNKKGKFANISYFFDEKEKTEPQEKQFFNHVKFFQRQGLSDYKSYMETKGQKPENTPWEQNSDRMNSIQTYTGIAWGQSELEASPLNMARVAGLVGNNGRLAPLRFLMNEPKQADRIILSPKLNGILASAMTLEASKWSYTQTFDGAFGGKTGTPMRTLGGKQIMNDGWYICFIKNASNNRILSIAVRLERLPHGMVSTEAVKFLTATVLPSLQECGYLK